MLSPQFAQSLRLFIVSLGNIPLFTNHFTRLQPQDFCIQIQDEADRDTGIWVLEVRGIQNIHKFGSSLSQRPQVLWKSRYLGILAEFSRFYSIIPLIDKSNSPGNSLKHITPGCTPHGTPYCFRPITITGPSLPLNVVGKLPWYSAWRSGPDRREKPPVLRYPRPYRDSSSNTSAIKAQQGRVEYVPPAPVSVCSPVRGSFARLYAAFLS